MRQTLDNVVPPRRFERLTYGLGIRCSILLSYGGNMFIYNSLYDYIKNKIIYNIIFCHLFATYLQIQF